MSKNLLVQRLRTLADAIERCELPIESFATVDTFRDASPVMISEHEFLAIFGDVGSPHIKAVRQTYEPKLVDLYATHPASGIAFQTLHYRPIELAIQSSESA